MNGSLEVAVSSTPIIAAWHGTLNPEPAGSNGLETTAAEDGVDGEWAHVTPTPQVKPPNPKP